MYFLGLFLMSVVYLGFSVIVCHLLYKLMFDKHKTIYKIYEIHENYGDTWVL